MYTALSTKVGFQVSRYDCSERLMLSGVTKVNGSYITILVEC